MTRNCKCGGRNVPIPGNILFAFFRCNKCGQLRTQRKRLSAENRKKFQEQFG